MKMKFFEFIKSVFHKEKVVCNRKFSVGDIVWATMPLPLEKLEKIPPTHRVRPYLIVHVDEKKGIYRALASTSNVAKKGLSKNSVIVYFDSTGKSSRIVTNTLWDLTDDSFDSFISQIKNKDAIKITKKLLFQNSSAMDLDFVTMYKDDVCVEVGDLIFIHDCMYYVYALENESYHLLRTYQHRSNRNNMNHYLQVRNYDVKLDKPIILDIENPAIIVDTLEMPEIVFIDSERLKYKSWARMEQKKSIKNKKKMVKEDTSVDDFCHKSLLLGDVIQYKGRNYVYLYTDTSKELFYLVDVDNLSMRPLKFCRVVPTSCDYIKCDALSDHELLRFLYKVKSLLDFLPYQDKKVEIFTICDIREKNIRKRV